MRAVTKARQILHTHGVLGLFRRGASKVRKTLGSRRAARRRRRAWERLISQAKAGPVFFPRHEKPLVSVLIAAGNDVRLTATCLNALLHELGSIPVEVIVVDDGSTDGTADYLKSCSGIRVLTHDTPKGPVQAINAAASVARGRYLHLLSSSAVVTPGWMPSLLRTFESRENVGAAGSQLRSADGSIYEAGALLWKNGQAERFGRGRDAKDAGVSFPREVDYCSRTSLMVRADVFRALGGLSNEFDRSEYVEADLCFRLRAAGYHVLYQPGSMVAERSESSSGSDEQRLRFAERWSAQLNGHYPQDNDLLERAARRLAGKRTVLVMDSFVPFEDRSAGARRLFAIMRLMRDLGWHVIFIGDDGGAYEPYAGRVRRAGIEVIEHRGDARSAIREIPVNVDVAWISRPDVLEKYLPTLRRHTSAKIIYDTVDLHYLRLQREAQVTGRQNAWTAVRELELSLARRCDCVAVTSAAEQRILANAEVESYVVPIIEEPVQTHAAYAARQNLLFLGNYTHEPNVDAATWLVTQIMPAVWERIPNVRVTLAGAEPTPAVLRLAGNCVQVTDHVADVRPLFDGARLFVAPLRFGAGMKGKIVQSLAHGLPVVTTAIGAEGIGLRDGVNAFIAEDAGAIAEAILRMYSDETLWSQIACASREAALQFAPGAVREQVCTVLEAALGPMVHVGVDLGLSAHTA